MALCSRGAFAAIKGAPRSEVQGSIDLDAQFFLDRPQPFGRYKLFCRIGAGGMGEVFLALEEAAPHPRVVVVKKILPDLVKNRAFVGRFRDESKVVVRLRHPNIARVYAMGEVSSEFFLAMEYVQGRTVSHFARRLRELGQKLPLGHILLLGERMCQGLAYAHEARDEHEQPLHLVHRDLSPSNLCVSFRGEVKIIDFGAAQSTLKEEKTAPRVVIGNLTYMSPEQARKQPVDRRADVYSAAAVLWELLAWRSLPQRGDQLERWRQAANPHWEAPSRFCTDVPPDVDALVLKALEKEKASRFPDAQAMGEALREALKRHAPEVDDRALGALLCSSFKAEKQVEDELLEQAQRLSSPVRPPSPPPRTLTPLELPPTALAFEHEAVSNLSEISELPADEPASDAALEASFRPAEATFVGFGVPIAPAPQPFGFGEPEYQTSYDTPQGGLPRGWLYAGVFVTALGVGFLGIWLWSLSN